MNSNDFENVIKEAINKIIILYHNNGSHIVGEFNRVNYTDKGYEISVNTQSGLVSKWVNPEDIVNVRVL